MMNNNLGAAGSKGLRQPTQHRGTLQSLMRPMTVAILTLEITVAICSAKAQHSHEAAQEHGDIESVQADTNHEEHEYGDLAHEFSLMSLAKPTGILTLSLVGLTVCSGLLRRVRRLKPRLLLKLHKIAGICALSSGAIHATIVLLTH